MVVKSGVKGKRKVCDEVDVWQVAKRQVKEDEPEKKKGKAELNKEAQISKKKVTKEDPKSRKVSASS